MVKPVIKSFRTSRIAVSSKNEKNCSRKKRQEHSKDTDTHKYSAGDEKNPAKERVFGYFYFIRVSHISRKIIKLGGYSNELLNAD